MHFERGQLELLNACKLKLVCILNHQMLEIEWDFNNLSIVFLSIHVTCYCLDLES